MGREQRQQEEAKLLAPIKVAVSQRETSDAAQSDVATSTVAPEGDEHADFLEYLNERFCGFTGS